MRVACVQQGSAASGVPSPSLLGQHAGGCHTITSFICPQHMEQEESTSAAGNHHLPTGFSHPGNTAQAAGRADKWGLTGQHRAPAVLC